MIPAITPLAIILDMYKDKTRKDREYSLNTILVSQWMSATRGKYPCMVMKNTSPFKWQDNDTGSCIQLWCVHQLYMLGILDLQLTVQSLINSNFFYFSFFIYECMYQEPSTRIGLVKQHAYTVFYNGLLSPFA